MKIDIKGVIVPNDDKMIYDWFGIDAVCPKDISAQLEAANGEDIEVEINSPGGDVYSGSEMYTALKSYTGNSIGRIVGVAASAAGVAAMGVKRLIISPTAQIMIHNAAGETRGDYRAHEHSADMLKGWNKSIANAYILKTGMQQNELLNMMNKETWLNAQDALKNKFVDEIMFDDELRLCASIRTSGLLPREVINKVRNMLTAEEGIKARAEPDKPEMVIPLDSLQLESKLVGLLNPQPKPDTAALKAKLALELELWGFFI